MGSKLNAMAPMPSCPALAKVGGLPQATQIGGWPSP
jgi:hypothetical protein